MNKKLRNQIIAIASMVVLSLGTIVCIKYTNGDFGAKQNTEALDVSAFANENATILEAARLLDSNNATTGYEVTVGAIGFNTAEAIQMKVTFDDTKTNVVSFEVVAHMETEGLGGNIAKPEFVEQINGAVAPVYTADMAAEGTAFDQVSGATLSSKAVAYGINTAYEFLATIQ